MPSPRSRDTEVDPADEDLTWVDWDEVLRPPLGSLGYNGWYCSWGAWDEPEQHSKSPLQILRPIAHSTTWIMSWDFFFKILLLGLILTLLLVSIQYFIIISYLKLFGHTPWVTWLITFSEIFLKSAIHIKKHMHFKQWHFLSNGAPRRWQSCNNCARLH